MDFDIRADDDWFISQMAEFIQRIRYLHEACQSDGTGDRSSDYEGNWERIHRHLVELHELVVSDADREAMSPLMQRLDLELAALEAVLDGSRARRPCSALH